MESGVIWVGINVGRYHHAFCGIDSAGRVVWERKKVLNTTLTMRRALDQLLRFARGRPLRLAAEEPGGNASALLRLLTAAGQQVYLAQPLRVHRLHLALGQPHKSDPYDAQVIAQFARQNAGKLPRVRIGTPDLQALRALSRWLEAIGKDLRRCLNRLRGVLAEYAPEWLVCGVFHCWAKEAALNTLQRYGRISKLQRTPVSRLSKAIRQWTHGQMGDPQARALLEAFADVSVPDEVEEAYCQVISSIIRQIRGLMAEKERLLELVAACASRCPALETLQAEFGRGLETGATIISEVGDVADFPRESAFATYCGVTPLKRKSGISAGSARLSRFTNRRLLRALIQTSYSAAHHHPESKAYYQSKLAGRSDPRAKTNALIALARHRVRRLYKILQSASQSQEELEVAA